MTSDNDLGILRRIARLYGIQPAYYDVSHRRQEASAESLLRTLEVLGAPVSGGKNLLEALRARRCELWQRVLEPVVVAWEGRIDARLRFPVREGERRFCCNVLLEDGGRQQWTGRLADLGTSRVRRVEGVEYALAQLQLPFPLPWGYHRMTLQFDGREAETHVISAPRTAWQQRGTESRRSIDSDGDALAEGDQAGAGARRRPPNGPSGLEATAPNSRCLWGVFLPLYALHRESSWGAGDFSDLQALMDWVSRQGGDLVATLPLLAWDDEISEDFSPYCPASRLFWNDFYLDVTRVPELEGCPAARALIASADFQSEIEALRRRRLVDYRRQMELKRRVLKLLAEAFFNSGGVRREQFAHFLGQNRELESYARFRAVGHRLGRPWRQWPERLKSGRIEPGDYDENIAQYHQYVQWQLHEQLTHLREHADRLNLTWYLDYPLGTARDGYDVWRNQNLFADGASGGAPPDAFFTKGQDWGFPPIHPERLRRQGYRYFIESLRHHLQFARLLRVDHVMSLHRLYWIPRGCEAVDGVYVRYHSEELLAIVALESHRHQAEIVGENLGTVPDAVNIAMRRHRLRPMYVLQYEIDLRQGSPLHPVPENAVASLNTHDMPMFAAFWTGLDIDDRVALGLLTEEQAREERDNRAALRRSIVSFLTSADLLEEPTLDPLAVLKACLTWLSGSPAGTVLVNLEDLWQETAPQNTPGTFRERNNWQRKTRYSFEQWTRLPQVLDVLHAVAQVRTPTSDSARSSAVEPGG